MCTRNRPEYPHTGHHTELAELFDTRNSGFERLKASDDNRIGFIRPSALSGIFQHLKEMGVRHATIHFVQLAGADVRVELFVIYFDVISDLISSGVIKDVDILLLFGRADGHTHPYIVTALDFTDKFRIFLVSASRRGERSCIEADVLDVPPLHGGTHHFQNILIALAIQLVALHTEADTAELALALLICRQLVISVVAPEPTAVVEGDSKEVSGHDADLFHRIAARSLLTIKTWPRAWLHVLDNLAILLDDGMTAFVVAKQERRIFIMPWKPFSFDGRTNVHALLQSKIHSGTGRTGPRPKGLLECPTELLVEVGIHLHALRQQLKPE